MPPKRMLKPWASINVLPGMPRYPLLIIATFTLTLS
jgi:hypothetical protein